MAGLYPDVPGPRIAYDRDGSSGVSFTGAGAVTVLTAGQLATLNDEDNDAVAPGSGGGIAILFPQLTTIIGWFTSKGNLAGAASFFTSVDTTNGFDGTWVQFSTALTNNQNINPGHRQLIKTATPVANIKAIRVNAAGGTHGYEAIHVYGYPDASSDRLEFWHPTLDQPLRTTPAYFDYGDVPRSAANIERDFRLKNLSVSLTANTITVGAEAATDASPTYVSQTEFRYNGGSYAATASLGSLAPDTISNVFTTKFDISATAALSIWVQRYYADASSWS